jgi:hypothetical protein
VGLAGLHHLSNREMRRSTPQGIFKTRNRKEKWNIPSNLTASRQNDDPIDPRSDFSQSLFPIPVLHSFRSTAQLHDAALEPWYGVDGTISVGLPTLRHNLTSRSEDTLSPLSLCITRHSFSTFLPLARTKGAETCATNKCSTMDSATRTVGTVFDLQRRTCRRQDEATQSHACTHRLLPF